MHLQLRNPGWLDAAMLLPDNSLLKSVHDASPLREAKQKWISLGRDSKKLVTVYRHFGLEPSADDASWEQATEHWKRNFAKFVDKTWLTQYASYVDLIEDCNEYTAVSTWVDDADHGKGKLLSMEAAAWVWNTFYRGKWVTSIDGGTGFIPATCKFTLMCGPVSNWFPVEVFKLSVKYDAPINYHSYFRCLNNERYYNDFHEDSGLWNNLESHYGIYPEWVFGEVMPYKSSAEGWRHSTVLNANQDLLVSISRAVQKDMYTTRAFRENRILGYGNFGAWFTVGGGEQWKYYELEAPQLIALAKMYKEEYIESPEDDMTSVIPNPEDRAKVRELLRQINNYVDPWWDGKTVPFVIPPQNIIIQIYKETNNVFVPFDKRNITYSMNVTAIKGDYLRVFDTVGTDKDLWVNARDIIVIPK